MSKHEEANLILKLYELRREETMRKARDWTFMNFSPETLEDFKATMFGEHGAYVRMVMSYWEMTAALVNSGAIGVDLFTETNGEHFAVFGKVELLLDQIRAAFGPTFCTSLEKLIDATPGGRERAAGMRARIQAMRAELAAKQTSAASA